MIGSNFGVRFVMSAVTALSVLALQTFAFSGAALAAHRSHGRHFAAYRHFHVRHDAMAVAAENFAPGIYDYAPAPQVQSFGQPAPLDGMAAVAASAAGVPVSLVERVIKRESGGNPRAVSRGNYGLMQIRLGTARAMGYSGSAAGLLDAQTNMTYAVRYLAGAYRAAHGNESRAVALYARGYYGVAKTQGFSAYASAAPSGFAEYPQAGFQMQQQVTNDEPVYRVRHYRHRAV
jgi:soluble lytic murein transglycosylase-like protein